MAEYRPQSWIKWLRVAILVLSIIIIALGAYAASQTWVSCKDEILNALLTA